MEILALNFPYLTLPQVLSWILERDAERIMRMSKTTSLAEFVREYIQGLQKQDLDALAIGAPSPDIGVLCWENFPIEDRKRQFLDQENLQLELLQVLPPRLHATFAEMLVRCLRDFHVSAGEAFPRAEQLAEDDLDRLEHWLDEQGHSIALRKLANEHARQNAEMFAKADSERQKAEASLISELAAGRIEAIASKDGTGNPEKIAANWWPMLSFLDREFGEHGGVTIAAMRHGAVDETCWTDLRFSAEGVFSIWPRDDFERADASQSASGKSMEPRRKGSPAFDGAQRAIEALFGHEIPEQSELPNAKFCKRVHDEMKLLGLESVSEDTILRAAGRRRKSRK